MTRFKNFIGEMTVKAGNLDKDMARIFNHYSSEIDDADLEHVGDIEHVKIMRATFGKKDFIDFFVKDGERIGISIMKRFQKKLENGSIIYRRMLLKETISIINIQMIGDYTLLLIFLDQMTVDYLGHAMR